MQHILYWTLLFSLHEVEQNKLLTSIGADYSMLLVKYESYRMSNGGVSETTTIL